MSSAATKESSYATYPKTLLSIISLVGGLALFLILASSVLVSQPIGSTVQGYLYGVDSSTKIVPDPSLSSLTPESNRTVDKFEDSGKLNVTVLRSHEDEVIPQDDGSKSAESGLGDGKETVVGENRPPESQDRNELSADGKETVVGKNPSPESQDRSELSADGKETVVGENRPPESQDRNELSADGKETVLGKNPPPETQDRNELSGSKPVESKNVKDKLPQSKGEEDLQKELKRSVDSSPATANLSQENIVDSGCDLYHGEWIYDTAGPLYTNNSCPIITQTQNCLGNGRPDKDYENWRWKPSQCDLPRFDARKFLELMRGKTIAFIGDSVARNQMESMMCILWQVEVPKHRGNKRMQRYWFRSTSTMIVRIWSSWLIHKTFEPFDFAPAGIVKLHLDAPDEDFMEFITGYDVIVLSSGHWFAKQSVYILNNEIVGGQLWWPDKSKPQKINNVEAFGISVETILTALATHPNYTGLTIVRSYSPDHYEGGAWNTGGSCTGKVKPASKGELVENGFTNIMHEKQVTGFNRAIAKKTSKLKMVMMDITEAFSYRHDAHPGPYRNPDPNKITKRGPDGRPPPQDCLHWCMPGAVDTWNELVFEIIRREFRDRESNSS